MFEIMPRSPITELSNLRRELDRLWEDFFGAKDITPAEGIWGPAVDISETKDSLIVKAELPGMEPKDIDISLSGDTLVIKGEKKQEKEEKGENFHRVERRYGSFARTIRLPVEVDSDKIEATYKQGVLKIVLPKKEEAKPKQIEIKTE